VYREAVNREIGASNSAAPVSNPNYASELEGRCRPASAATFNGTSGDLQRHLRCADAAAQSYVVGGCSVRTTKLGPRDWSAQSFKTEPPQSRIMGPMREPRPSDRARAATAQLRPEDTAMNTVRMYAGCIAVLLCGIASHALAQDAEPTFNSNADDVTKIRGVLEEFRQDVIRKDGYALTKLVLNPNVLFHHTNTQEEIDGVRKYDAQFDGIGSSQLDEFAKLLATSKDKLEERFRNIEIHQDGPLGLVTFNYDFVINDKVHHSGLEAWQVCKIDGQWKILSVVWTIYR
jgi:hypothetical protein